MGRVAGLPVNLPRIDVPYNTVKSRYAKHVADLMAKLATSSAAAARGKTADAFTWSLEYEQAPDPDTTDAAAFTAQLVATSAVYLVVRGFKWKGWSQLSPNEIPPAVLARFEERARLLCSPRTPVEQPEPPAAVAALAETSDRTLLASLDAWLRSHPRSDRRIARIVRVALDQLLQSAE